MRSHTPARETQGTVVGMLSTRKVQVFLISILVILSNSYRVNSQETPEECVVQFTVDESRSSLSLSADLVKPIPVGFTLPFGDVISQGLRGSVFGTLNGPCPTQGQELVDALFAGGVVLKTEENVLRYYPSNVTVRDDGKSLIDGVKSIPRTT